MKCLVFSDSHGRSFYMEKALSLHPDTEVVFFLGDGIRDISSLADKHPDKAFIAVRGNCDFSGLLRGGEVGKVEGITLMEKRIFLTHGDLYGVKYGTSGIEAFAEGRRADIVLFGHTHTPLIKYVSAEEKYKNEGEDFITPPPYYLFNPGSIGEGSEKSYGVMTLTEGGVLLSHGKFV